MCAAHSAEAPFTPEGTIGPFYPGVFVAQMPHDLTTVAPLQSHRPAGTPIQLRLRFLDAASLPVRSVIVECWQANADGRYRHPADRSGRALDPHFDGFARLRTGDDGICVLCTVKPGAHAAAVAGAAGSPVRAPHVRLTIFASGIDRIVTQVFFDDEPGNAADPVLGAVSAGDRERLIARRVNARDADGGTAYELTIRMRGDGETPFIDDWASEDEHA